MGVVHPRETVEAVLCLCTPDTTTRDVARVTGVPESTIAKWRRGDRRRAPDRIAPCPRCTDAPTSKSYAYLLGAYLGDGHTHEDGGTPSSCPSTAPTTGPA